MTRDLLKEQETLSKKGGAWIAGRLIDRLMFSIRTGGTIKELTVRLERDGEIFPLEWFRDFLVTLWLTDGTAIVCNVGEVKEIKRKWFFIKLTPQSICGQEGAWNNLEETRVKRIELSTGGERHLFVWENALRLFTRQEVH
jgi:hypothetical protein